MSITNLIEKGKLFRNDKNLAEFFFDCNPYSLMRSKKDYRSILKDYGEEIEDDNRYLEPDEDQNSNIKRMEAITERQLKQLIIRRLSNFNLGPILKSDQSWSDEIYALQTRYEFGLNLDLDSVDLLNLLLDIDKKINIHYEEDMPFTNLTPRIAEDPRIFEISTFNDLFNLYREKICKVERKMGLGPFRIIKEF